MTLMLLHRIHNSFIYKETLFFLSTYQMIDVPIKILLSIRIQDTPAYLHTEYFMEK